MFLILFFACQLPHTSDSNAVDVTSEMEETRPNEPLNLNHDVDNLNAFVKMRGSLDDTEDVVFYWTGTIYNQDKIDAFESYSSYYSSPILYFEGFNISRMVKISDTEYQMLSREISLYKDRFGNVIDCWDPSAIGEHEQQNVQVVHVMNDPVNFIVSGANYTEIGDMVTWNMEVVMGYESPLPVDEYPAYSASNTYQSAELFNFFTQRSDLEDPTLNTVPVTISWSRIGQYLPWMQQGQRDGKLLYHTHGYKVLDGFEALPNTLKNWVTENAPEYQKAPVSAAPTRNMTSWRYMKKLLDNEDYAPDCN